MNNLTKWLQNWLALWINEQWKDISGNWNNATVIGATPIRLINDREWYSIVNWAWWTPANQYLSLTNSASLSPWTWDFTINIWFNTTDSRSYANRFLVTKYNSSNTNNTYQVYMTTSQYISWYYRDWSWNAISVTWTSAINDWKWHMVSSVRIWTTMYLYLDSRLIWSNTNASIWNIDTNSAGSYTFIWAYWTTTSVWNLDNAYSWKLLSPKIFSRGLSATEIQMLYYWTFIK